MGSLAQPRAFGKGGGYSKLDRSATISLISVRVLSILFIANNSSSCCSSKASRHSWCTRDRALRLDDMSWASSPRVPNSSLVEVRSCARDAGWCSCGRPVSGAAPPSGSRRLSNRRWTPFSFLKRCRFVEPCCHRLRLSGLRRVARVDNSPFVPGTNSASRRTLRTRPLFRRNR